MKIVQIEASIVRAELSKPYRSALDKKGMTAVDCVVLQMHSDTGLVGIAESNPYPGFTSESPASVMQNIRQTLGPAVLGLDPTNIVALNQAMDAAVAGVPFAKAPLDIAAHDLWGKSLGVPVYQLLGGRVRDKVPMIWAIGGGTPEETVQEALAKIEEGYRTLHVKLGTETPEEDVIRLKTLREAIGPDIFIMADVNQDWDVPTALRAVPQMEPFNLSMIEQPVSAGNIDGLAQVQAAVSTPISADESLSSPQQAMTLIRRDAVRAFSLKTGKCGGLFRTRQIAAIIEAAGLPCFVNSMIEMGISVATSLHVAASVPNLIGGGHGHALMSNLRIKEDILVDGSFQYDGRSMIVPDSCPGLGVKIDESKLERRTTERFVINI